MSKETKIARRLTIVFRDDGMTRLNFIVDVSAKYSDSLAQEFALDQLKDKGYLRIKNIYIPYKLLRWVRIHSLEKLDEEGIVS